MYKEKHEASHCVNDSQNETEKYNLMTGFPNEIYLREILTERIASKAQGQFLILIRVTNYNEIIAGYGCKIIDETIVNMLNRFKFIFNGIGELHRISKNEILVLGDVIDDIHKLDLVLVELNNATEIGFNSKSGIIFINLAMGVLSLSNNYNDVSRIIEDLELTTDLAEKNNNERYVYYSETIRERLKKDIRLATLLRAAVANMELSLMYQPQIDPRTNRIVGVEALLRWHNDELGQVSPNVFIPIAEKMGNINDIGNWVLREACKQNKRWQEKGLPKIPVSVNLSPTQFKHNKIEYEIEDILEDCNLEGKYLNIEITETTLLENERDISKRFCTLRNMGISISIDDFGTGYSSLKYLKELDFDNIKIDRDFIKDYPDNDNGTIARLILTLSRELKVSTTAEGVETKEQLDFIMANGGDYIQGYYYSPPISAEKIEELLTKKYESA
ncbi:MAG: GGDEF domain-containing phosphodiesterase [Tissierellales bacterium]